MKFILSPSPIFFHIKNAWLSVISPLALLLTSFYLTKLGLFVKNHQFYLHWVETTRETQSFLRGCCTDYLWSGSSLSYSSRYNIPLSHPFEQQSVYGNHHHCAKQKRQVKSLSSRTVNIDAATFFIMTNSSALCSMSITNMERVTMGCNYRYN